VRITFDDQLPISARRDEIARAVAAHQALIVCGETGSGKTTQLPKILLQMGRGQGGRLIGHTQPRRIAASSIARRIAAELETDPGEVVGYKVRFTDRTRPGASIKLMTDGILLAEIESDPLLRAYDTIIVDEAHERSLNIDFLLGCLLRLLPRRPELRLVITSATIDADRFARHFGAGGQPAPVLQVSGRTWPVEMRYRPFLDDDREGEEPAFALRATAGAPAPLRVRERKSEVQAILEAVDELAGAGRGDVLVFLPGEREIREAAEALRKHHPPGTEILPLFARLSAPEQERVFHPSGARRIVLATNVAETSLTVPGIRFVVDTGLARVKRYSYRNKVEQLRIEPVSRAAADQRAGRCGRTSGGICIRLYSGDDYEARPRFTDPEVLRSSLAGVILRMHAHGLGDPAQFPFLDPPPARAIADGQQLLAELHAVDDRGALTDTGRALARLPLDPRIARILHAANGQHCLREALIVAAALSVQDPRERPAGAPQAADEAHKRHAHESSDFLSLVNLWNHVQERIGHKKSNRQLESGFRGEFLHARRIREWIDVHSQLLSIVAEQDWRVNTGEATYEQVHRALLAGLLGNIGCRSAEADPADRREPPWLGARGIKFHVAPGSGRGRRAGRWIVAAEILETTRLFARTVAEVEPEWIEAAGAHLVRRSWGDAHWERRAGQAMTMERGTLHGLTLYQRRRVPLAPIDPGQARELLLREGLVAGQWQCPDPFLARNLALVEELRELEHRRRRPDLVVDEERISALYEERIPKDVCTGAALLAWLRGDPSRGSSLVFTREDLLRRDEEEGVAELHPRRWQVQEAQLELSYHFEPGSVRDGVTLGIPIHALNHVTAARCDWLVPGMRKEKATALLKSLAQRFRRSCVPLPEYAQAFLGRRGERDWQAGIDMVHALIADLREQRGVQCTPGDFRPESLPAHLTMNFKVIDEHGRQLQMGRNLAALQAEFGAMAQKSFREIAQRDAPGREAAPITDWDFGELPAPMQVGTEGGGLTGYPALADHGTHCLIEVFEDAAAAASAHRAGLARLLRLQLREPVKQLEKSLASLQRSAMRASAVPGWNAVEPLAGQVIEAAIERVGLEEPLPAGREAFLARRDEARARVGLVAREIARLVEQVIEDAASAARKLQGLKVFPQAVQDMEQQLQRLFGRRFVAATPAPNLASYPRYLRAIAVRADRLREMPQRDAERMRELSPLQTRWMRELCARKGVVDPRLEEFRWLLEELRVSLFAQELRTPFPVSVKRLEKVWSSLER
jgi:ATP-dependent helicase HrpA